MKIWCCLCFTEGDEGEDFDDTIMKEGFPVIEGDPEGNIGNRDDVEMQLGLSLDLFGRRDAADEVDSFRSLEDMIAMRTPLVGGGGSGGEAALAPVPSRPTKWWSLVRGPRRFEGESSGGVACAGGGSSLASDDLHHKRARVLTST